MRRPLLAIALLLAAGAASAQTIDYVQRSLDRTVIVRPDGRGTTSVATPGTGPQVIYETYKHAPRLQGKNRKPLHTPRRHDERRK